MSINLEFEEMIIQQPSATPIARHGVHGLPNDGVPALHMAVLARPGPVRRVANGANIVLNGYISKQL